MASLRKFSPVVFRPAVAGLLECPRVLASLLGEKAVDGKAMRRRLALPKHFVQDAIPLDTPRGQRRSAAAKDLTADYADYTDMDRSEFVGRA